MSKRKGRGSRRHSRGLPLESAAWTICGRHLPSTGETIGAEKENPGGSALHAAKEVMAAPSPKQVRWGKSDPASCRRPLLPPVTGGAELECAYCPNRTHALIWCDRTIV